MAKDKLMEGLAEYQRKIEAGEIERTKPELNLIVKAKKHPTSKHKAIAAFCFHCMGGTETEAPDPNWRQAIKDCTSPTCPLYPHRPGK